MFLKLGEAEVCNHIINHRQRNAYRVPVTRPTGSFEDGSGLAEHPRGSLLRVVPIVSGLFAIGQRPEEDASTGPVIHEFFMVRRVQHCR